MMHIRSKRSLILLRRRLAEIRQRPLFKSTLTFEQGVPTSKQLRDVFVRAALPMVGFGFMDQTVMLQAGNAIDCTLGVTFGLSTLTAAAFGQVCSDAAGVAFGGTLESLARKAGLPQSTLTAAQRQLPIVQQAKFAGTLAGIVLGCCLGLVNLFFIDTERSSTLKLQEFATKQEFSFRIEASNAVRSDVTALKVRGPDVDGLLASMTTALTVQGCSLVELTAKKLPNGEIEDIFYVVQRDGGGQYENDDLDYLARAVLESTRKPMSVLLVKKQLKDVEQENEHLKERVRNLENDVLHKQVSVVRG